MFRFLLLPILGIVLFAWSGAMSAVSALQDSPEPTVQQAFDAGHAAYIAHDYVRALQAYQQAEATGQVSGALYFNMGNTYFRLNQLGQAIRYYERAKRLLPDDPHVAHSLQIARERTLDQFSTLRPPFWVNGWQTFRTFFGAHGLLWIGLIGYVLSLGLIGHRLWTGQPNPWRRRVLMILLPLMVAFLSAAFLASAETAADHRAVVIHTEASLYEAPTASAPVQMRIHEGLVVNVLAAESGWHQVRLSNGATGWIEAGVLADI